MRYPTNDLENFWLVVARSKNLIARGSLGSIKKKLGLARLEKKQARPSPKIYPGFTMVNLLA